MNLLSFYKYYGSDAAERVALEAGTTLANFKQIMYGGSVSRKLAKRLSNATGDEVTIMEILYPEPEENSAA